MEQFSIVKRGYNPEEVDYHIEKLEKIIEDYKEKDSSISNAIMNAQIAADNIIKNSHLAAEEIRSNTISHLDTVYNSITKQKEVVKDFQEQYFLLVSKYLKDVQTTDFLDIFSSINELENYMVSLKKGQTPEKASSSKNGKNKT